MNVDTLPGDPEFVFFAEALPEGVLHRIATVAEGPDCSIPAAMIAVILGNALRLGGAPRPGTAPAWAVTACRERIAGGWLTRSVSFQPPTAALPFRLHAARAIRLRSHAAAVPGVRVSRMPGKRPEEQREKGSPVPGAITKGD